MFIFFINIIPVPLIFSFFEFSSQSYGQETFIERWTTRLGGPLGRLRRIFSGR